MTQTTADRNEGMGGGRVAADELRLLIERAERLEEEKKGISAPASPINAVVIEAMRSATRCCRHIRR